MASISSNLALKPPFNPLSKPLVKPSTTSAPSTPLVQAYKPPIITPSPGTWRHPKFDEIARRQNNSNFTERHWRKFQWNGLTFVATFLLSSLTESYLSTVYSILPTAAILYSHYPLLFFRILLIFNILTAILPLARDKDHLTDIPLTPSQRSLLGLEPNVTPSQRSLTGQDPSATTSSTPGSQYVTPPRYPRSTTPRSGTPGSRSISNSGSPLARKASPVLGRQGMESSFSPSASPLWQKTLGGGRDSLRRHSYGSPSPLGPTLGIKEGSVFGGPGTPSPSTGRGASVGLNSRWLYKRGRASPSKNGYS